MVNKENVVSIAVTAAAAAAATQAAVVATDIAYIKRDIGEIKDSVRGLSSEYVTKAEFDPVKRIVYGLIGVLGIATMGALLKLVLVP